jgi:hypothetical protein
MQLQQKLATRLPAAVDQTEFVFTVNSPGPSGIKNLVDIRNWPVSIRKFDKRYFWQIKTIPASDWWYGGFTFVNQAWNDYLSTCTTPSPPPGSSWPGPVHR